MRHNLFIVAAVLVLSGCEIEKTVYKDFFAPGYDLVRIQKLYPTAWETSYNVIAPGPTIYFSKSRYDLVSPVTPAKVQSYLRGLRAWSAQVYNFLVTLMNHDPVLSYQAGDWHTAFNLESRFSTTRDRSTTSFLSRLSSDGFIRFYDLQRNPLDVFFQLSSPDARFSIPNPLLEQSAVGTSSSAVVASKKINIPEVGLSLFSSEAWKNADRFLLQPGFRLKGRLGITQEEDGIRVSGKELNVLSTVRVGNANYQISLGGEPGFSYRLSSSGKSGLYDAKLSVGTEAAGSIPVADTGFRLDQLALHGKYFSINPAAFLSEMGVAGSWTHVDSRKSLRVDLTNKLWMKKDVQTNTFLKARNLLSGSLSGQWPGAVTAAPDAAQTELTHFSIPAFELYFDAGDTLKNGLPENIQILLSVRGATFQFGELRTAVASNELRKPMAVTLRFRALLNLNLSGTTLYSRDNMLMASVDYISFEGDLPQASIALPDTALYSITVPGKSETLGRLLFQHIKKEQSREIQAVSDSALGLFNQGGDVPELVKALREQISLLRVEKFDEQLWSKIYSRAQHIQADFESTRGGASP